VKVLELTLVVLLTLSVGGWFALQVYALGAQHGLRMGTSGSTRTIESLTLRLTCPEWYGVWYERTCVELDRQDAYRDRQARRARVPTDSTLP